MNGIERDDTNQDWIVYSWNSVRVYIARDDYHMIWFEGWDSLEILQSTEMLALADMLVQVENEVRGMQS